MGGESPPPINLLPSDIHFKPLLKQTIAMMINKLLYCIIFKLDICKMHKGCGQEDFKMHALTMFPFVAIATAPTQRTSSTVEYVIFRQCAYQQ